MAKFIGVKMIEATPMRASMALKFMVKQLV